jgi:pimeloyl-ACP methyl ester carboxylesterase
VADGKIGDVAKIPLVFVPGLLCDDRLWRHQAEHLADLVDPIIVYVTEDGSMPEMALAVLNTAPERFALAGLSMGGYVALQVVRDAPERVARLALLDTSARTDRYASGTYRTLARGTLRRGPTQVTPKHSLSRAARRRTANVYRICHGGSRLARGVRTPGGGDNRASGQPRGPTGHRLPTLVLCGREDALTPMHLYEEMADLIPGSRLRVTEKCGHLSALERAEGVTAVLRKWLDMA